MQNTEIEELANKKVSFQLETNEGKDYSEKDNCGREYVVLWYDAIPQ